MNYSYSLISFKLLKLPNYLEGAPATDIGKSATSPSAHLVLNLPEFSHTSPTSLFGSGGFGFAYKKIAAVHLRSLCFSHTHIVWESERVTCFAAIQRSRTPFGTIRFLFFSNSLWFGFCPSCWFVHIYRLCESNPNRFISPHIHPPHLF